MGDEKYAIKPDISPEIWRYEKKKEKFLICLFISPDLLLLLLSFSLLYFFTRILGIFHNFFAPPR